MELSRIKALLVGHAVGDALGVPVEFMSREELAKNPVREMRGFGSHNVPPGTWSDDTSMTLCLSESLGRMRLIDCLDIMKNFVRWIKNAEFTATGTVFDVGIATREAVERFLRGTPPLACGGTGEYDNGNGSLMRISPLAIYCCEKNLSVSDSLSEAHKLSSLTHAHPRSQIACGIYTLIAVNLLAGHPLRIAIKKGLSEAQTFYENEDEYSGELSHYERLRDFDGFAGLSEDDIGSSGYVVDTLEASLWCLANTKNYRDAVLTAVNLGDDTDTIGATVGGLAGLAYGFEDIPPEWKRTLLKLDYIEELCRNLTGTNRVGKDELY